MKAYIRKIRYIHQGPTSAIGWQVYINDLNSNPLVLKEFIVEDQALTYLTNFNNAAGAEDDSSHSSAGTDPSSYNHLRLEDRFAL